MYIKLKELDWKQRKFLSADHAVDARREFFFDSIHVKSRYFKTHFLTIFSVLPKSIEHIVGV